MSSFTKIQVQILPKNIELIHHKCLLDTILFNLWHYNFSNQVCSNRSPYTFRLTVADPASKLCWLKFKHSGLKGLSFNLKQ